MVERPVIFNGEMVMAILAGRKTQTRRVMKQQPPDGWCPVNSLGVADMVARPYTKGVVDRHGCLQAGPEVFGVADETWGAVSPFGKPGDRLWVRETFGDCGVRLVYRADTGDGASCQVTRWTPSIHMPRSACRLLLDIAAVRAERLKDISEADAEEEGVDFLRHIPDVDETLSARQLFECLWVSIYGQESWDSNPLVWVVEFKQVQG